MSPTSSHSIPSGAGNPTWQVLIIEDVDSMLRLLEHVLKDQEGFVVSGLARNGWEARIELSRRRPDLVLLDEILPGESSVDLLRDFHEQGIPVVLVTSVKEPDHPCPVEALGRIRKPGWKTVEDDRARILGELRTLLRQSAL